MPQVKKPSRIQIQVEKGPAIPYSRFQGIGTGRLRAGFQPGYTPINQTFEETK
jgi:hypothetical protein